jgi:hypothetical protein
MHDESREIQLAEILRRAYIGGKTRPLSLGGHWAALTSSTSVVADQLKNLCKSGAFKFATAPLVEATKAKKSILGVDVMITAWLAALSLCAGWYFMKAKTLPKEG